MFKFLSKPIWIATLLLLGAVGVELKLALAMPLFTSVNQPVGYVAPDRMTNLNLASGHEILFRGQYEREFWSGNLLAYGLNSEADISVATQPWGTGAVANQIDQQGTNRLIVTLKTDGTKVPFVWDNLSNTQQGNLTSAEILAYLRGDRSGEVQQGGAFRQRGSALGDIVHSQPLYVSDGFDPAGTETDTKPTVFVGANDGMLHAIDVRTGQERWAYVPSMLIPKMKNLSVNPAVGSSYPHEYYVDGSPVVATILAGTKRVLVGTLGAGGKGLYALDITGRARLAPATEAAAASNILWEITPTTLNNAANTTYANLGDTYATPTIGRVAGTDAVIVGNGYNNGGNYQAWLYVINADTGALISAIQAGTSGTATSPNGLSNTVAVDNNNDGDANTTYADTVYAGDINGTLWKFNLTAGTATALYTTSPAQPITMTPGVSSGPGGVGYMVNFATGAMLTTADTTDTATFAAYGIWDGAPAANAAILVQTLTERCYTPGTTTAATPCASRVRTVSNNPADWTEGATHHKGWKVALPAKEKVMGDGSFVRGGRFYFTSNNPTITSTVQSSTVYGENWLMELDTLTGGSKNFPFLDLSANALLKVLDDDDRIKYKSGDTLPTTTPATTIGSPIMTTDGIPVGKHIGIGVMSQPILVELSLLNNTLFNQNPDVTIVPVELGSGAGVTGGHFDVDIFYATPTAGAQASATITVGTSGQIANIQATLGAITVDGVTIVPALTVTDLPNGTANSVNAATIKSKVTGGFTATVSGSVITIKAPAGVQYNGKAITIGPGTSQTPQVAAVAARDAVTGKPAVAAEKPTGFITFTGTSTNTYEINDDLNSKSIRVGGANAEGSSIVIGKTKTAVQAAATVVSAIGTSNDYKAYVGGNSVTLLCKSQTSNVVCIVDNSSTNYEGNNGKAITVGSIKNPGGLTFTTTPTAGGVNAVAAITEVTAITAVTASGWTNFAPALTKTNFTSSGVEPVTSGDTCADTTCKYDQHVHQYDDAYDVTGVNMLNPSDTKLDLKRGIPSLVQDFKVLVHNQYLNPAVKLHIGDPGYLYNVDFGYLSLKSYQTASTLDLATVQTYRRDPNAVWPGTATTDAAKLALAKPIGSLAFNMPLDALTPKDWWGGTVADVRVGLHPTVYSCVWQAKGSTDGNMYQPVNPPANGTDGPGTVGWSSSTTPATATGARHNGALVVQIIRATTPNTALELNVASRPEYGWRVKSALYSTYVLAEYATYWHHPNGRCYSSTGWSKNPAADNGSSSLSNKAAGATDPHLGDLSAGSTGTGTITASTTTIVGNVTTTLLTYSNVTTASIVRTVNPDGSVTITTRDALNVTTTQTIANSSGSLRTGGDESRDRNGRVISSLALGSGLRISWQELVAP